MTIRSGPAPDPGPTAAAHLSCLERTLALLPVGLMAVGRHAMVHMLNPAARHALAAARGLHLQDGRLVATRPAQAFELARALRTAETGGPATRLQADGPGGSLIAHIHPHAPPPASAGSVSATAASPGAIVLLLTSGMAPAELSEAVRRRFGLTLAEARLASALASGDSLLQYATARGLTIHTVRTQLRSASARMGVTRQIDLVRRVLIEVVAPAAYLPGRE